ncbi:MAG: dihydroorotate dehydrogenase-like protein [Verrucomicrobia bacterium]|nr:dihydroorotate dehydrogenase-like protein [Verrucomicrobiota bacterium]
MDLATSYLGLSLPSPFIVGSSPLCDDVNVARKLEDCGAAAVTMRSLFEEQLTGERPPASRGAGYAGEGEAQFPEFADYQFSPDQYLRQVGRLKRSLTIPVIASLNSRQAGTWIGFARRLEEAGADAIELNCYHVITDPAAAADEAETEMLEAAGALAASVSLPIAVKLSPFHASVAQLAIALELAGAAGIVVFNRFYQPDVDIDELKIHPVLRLSDSGELLLRLRWLAILSPHLRCSLAVTGGVHTAADAVKALLTGADALQLVSVLLRHGPHALGTLRQGLEHWMREHRFAGVGEFRGRLNLRNCHDPAALERANYLRVLQSWSE